MNVPEQHCDDAHVHKQPILLERNYQNVHPLGINMTWKQDISAMNIFKKFMSPYNKEQLLDFLVEVNLSPEIGHAWW